MLVDFAHFLFNESRYCYITVTIDHFDHRVYLGVIMDKTAISLAKALFRYLVQFGAPDAPKWPHHVCQKFICRHVFYLLCGQVAAFLCWHWRSHTPSSLGWLLTCQCAHQGMYWRSQQAYGNQYLVEYEDDAVLWYNLGKDITESVLCVGFCERLQPELRMLMIGAGHT